MLTQLPPMPKNLAQKATPSCAGGASPRRCVKETATRWPSKLVERMAAENNRDCLNALATVLGRIAKGIDARIANRLSQRLMQRVAHDHDARSREALIAGLAALEQSEGLIDTLLQEHDPYGLQILARDASGFEKNLTPAQADELARKLTTRLIGDLNPLAVDALVALLKPLRKSELS